MNTVNRTPERLLDPQALARFSNLELLAKTVAEGAMTGLHRSPHFGFSQEFAEYRAFNDGDDLRFVDWNVYARTDRMYIKRYRGDTNTTLMIAVDASSSMNFGSHEVSKLDYARYLSASLAWLARKQHDAIGALVFDTTVRELLPPSTRPDALPRLLGLLEQTRSEEESGSGTDVNAALDALQAISVRKGLLSIISDFYTPPDALRRNLEALVHRGQDIGLFHIIDPAEMQPAYTSVTALRDLESGATVNVDPEYLGDEYQQRFIAHCEALRELARQLGVDYTQVNTAEPLDNCLHRYLFLRRGS